MIGVTLSAATVGVGLLALVFASVLVILAITITVIFVCVKFNKKKVVLRNGDLSERELLRVDDEV